MHSTNTYQAPTVWGGGSGCTAKNKTEKKQTKQNQHHPSEAAICGGDRQGASVFYAACWRWRRPEKGSRAERVWWKGGCIGECDGEGCTVVLEPPTPGPCGLGRTASPGALGLGLCLDKPPPGLEILTSRASPPQTCAIEVPGLWPCAPRTSATPAACDVASATGCPRRTTIVIR